MIQAEYSTWMDTPIERRDGGDFSRDAQAVLDIYRECLELFGRTPTFWEIQKKCSMSDESVIRACRELREDGWPWRFPFVGEDGRHEPYDLGACSERRSVMTPDAVVVSDLCMKFREEAGRMPSLKELRRLIGLESWPIDDRDLWAAVSNLFNLGWDDYQRYVTALEPKYSPEYAPKNERQSPKTERVARKRQPVVGDLRALVWAKSDGICWYCGTRLNPFTNLHVDHFIPVADGGTNDPHNLVPACQRCNGEKGAKHLEAFRAARGGCIFWFERVAK